MTNLPLPADFSHQINARRRSFDSSHKGHLTGTSGPCHFRTRAVQQKAPSLLMHHNDGTG
jgi:hypothetical protein